MRYYSTCKPLMWRIHVCYTPIANHRPVCKTVRPVYKLVYLIIHVSRPAQTNGSVSRPFRLVNGPA